MKQVKTLSDFIAHVAQGKKVTPVKLALTAKRLNHNPEQVKPVSEVLAIHMPSLPFEQSNEMISVLKNAWRGNSTSARTNHPFLVQHILQIQNAYSVKVCGMFAHEMAGGNITVPVYILIYTSKYGQEQGFKFYIQGGNVVIAD